MRKAPGVLRVMPLLASACKRVRTTSRGWTHALTTAPEKDPVLETRVDSLFQALVKVHIQSWLRSEATNKATFTMTRLSTNLKERMLVYFGLFLSQDLSQLCSP